jgi:acrylyl-CoA reductase (NADPH)
LTEINSQEFKALWVEENSSGKFTRRIIKRQISDLPPGDILVRVQYSALNYKDALSASGNRGVTRHYPHTPGIDVAGIVVESTDSAFHPGDPVVSIANEIGVSLPGGFGQYIRVPTAMIQPLPAGISLRESMIYGTAGLTAAYGVYRLEGYSLAPNQGEVVVTGATGGVGTFAVALLAQDGFSVTAATGKTDQEMLLKNLGANEVIHREKLNDTSGKGLLSARWAGAFDTVGGNYLATILKSTRHGGVVACCGNTASAELNLTVYPFILRGVALLGIDITQVNSSLRQELWSRIGGQWKIPRLETLARECTLEGLEPEIERILHGDQTGRVIVNLQE